MKIKPDFDTKKWCVYNEEKFRLELKDDAPQKIREKFKKWEDEYNERYIIEK